jgi:signal recognition particle subunit SRP54
VFDTLSDRLSGIFTKLRGKGRLSDADIDATAREIRLALLEADVALPVVKAFIHRLKERARGSEVSKALNPAQQIIKIVHEEIIGVLGGEARRLNFAKNPPTVIMLAGLQGSGKTTLAGKLARWLKGQGSQPLLVAADLQRPNAVNQLQVLGQRAGVEVFAPEPGNGVGDPVAVAKDSIEHARRHMRDVVIVDTAGRLGIDAEMMAQAVSIREAVEPDEIIFVIDAMVGQDAVATATAFRDGVGITGVVLSKLDGDSRGGAALSVREVTGQPILFASTGEKLEDFDMFHPDRMASRILGMGDMLTLIEQAEAAFDADQKEKMTAKLLGGEVFTLEDFLDQLIAVRRMGPISNMLGMMPGMGQMKDQLAQLDDKHFDRVTAIIRSMTPQERTNPKVINGSRRARIARGSGVTVMDVNQLLNRFENAQKMMKQMGGMMGLPGMRRKATKSPKNKRKGKASGGGGPRMPFPGGAIPGGMPQLPPGLDADAFKAPNLDFGKLMNKRDKDK